MFCIIKIRFITSFSISNKIILHYILFLKSETVIYFIMVHSSENVKLGFYEEKFIISLTQHIQKCLLCSHYVSFILKCLLCSHFMKYVSKGNASLWNHSPLFISSTIYPYQIKLEFINSSSILSIQD